MISNVTTRTAKQVNQEALEAFDKAQTEGASSLTDEEFSHYVLYLTLNSFKHDKDGHAYKPVPAIIAKKIIAENYLFVLNQMAYIYNYETGTYEPDSNDNHLGKLIREELGLEFTNSAILKDIYNLITTDEEITITDNQVNNRPKHWIHFLNGYFDYKKNDWHPNNHEYNEISLIPWEYNSLKFPSCYKIKEHGKKTEPLLFDHVFRDWFPNWEDREMVLQYIGYCMTLDTSKQKFLLLCGKGGTGKSTLLSLIEEILGKNNVSSISLQGLQDRFAPGELYLKQANICADIPLTALSEIDTIKKLTGEDLISAERKFKDRFLFRSYARLIFSANDIPVNLSDKTNALYRRMLIGRMDQVPDQVDPDLFEKLKSEIPNIISQIVDELVTEEGDIYESQNSKRYVHEAQKASDSIEAFIDDRCEIDRKARMNRVTLYIEYYNYCVTEGRTSLKKSEFYRQMESKGFPNKRGKDCREIVGIKLSNIMPMSLPETTTSNQL